MKLRAALNDANTALDEDTQRGTDRLARATIQDLVEVPNRLESLQQGASAKEKNCYQF